MLFKQQLFAAADRIRGIHFFRRELKGKFTGVGM
jgi:hypothetical protein